MQGTLKTEHEQRTEVQRPHCGMVGVDKDPKQLAGRQGSAGRCKQQQVGALGERNPLTQKERKEQELVNGAERLIATAMQSRDVQPEDGLWDRNAYTSRQRSA